MSYQDFQTRLKEGIAGDLGLSSDVGTHMETMARAESRRATSHSEQLEHSMKIAESWRMVAPTQTALGLLDPQELSEQEMDEVIERLTTELLAEAVQRIEQLPMRDETKATLKEIYAGNLADARTDAKQFAGALTSALKQAAARFRNETLTEQERASLDDRLRNNGLTYDQLMRAQTPAHLLDYAMLRTALSARSENIADVRTVIEDYVRRGTAMNSFAMRPDSERVHNYSKGAGFMAQEAFVARRLWRAIENNLVTLADSRGQHLLAQVYEDFRNNSSITKDLADGMEQLLGDDLLRAQMVTQAIKPVAQWLGLPKDAVTWQSYSQASQATKLKNHLQSAGLYEEGDALPDWPSARGVHKILQASFYQQITQLPSLGRKPEKHEPGFEAFHQSALVLAGRFAAALTLQETYPTVSLEEMRTRPMSTTPIKRGDETLYTRIFIDNNSGDLLVDAAKQYSADAIDELLAQQDANMLQNYAQQIEETFQMWRESGRDYTDSKLYKACQSAGIEIHSGADIIALATQSNNMNDVPALTALTIRQETRRMLIEHLKSVERAEESPLAIPFGCTALDTAWQHTAQIPTTFMRRALEMKKLSLNTQVSPPELQSQPVVTDKEKYTLLAICDAFDQGRITAHDYSRVTFNFLVGNEAANRKDIHTIIQDAQEKGFITHEQSKTLGQQLDRSDLQVGVHSLASALGFVVNDMHGVFHSQQQGTPHHTAALTVLSCASLVNTTQAIRALTHGSSSDDTALQGPTLGQANAAMAGTTYTHGIKGKGVGSSTLGIAMVADKSANMFIRERLDTFSQKPRKFLSNAATHESAHIIDYSMGAAMAKYLTDMARDTSQSASVRLAAAHIVHLMPSAASKALPGRASKNSLTSAENSIDTLMQAEVNSATKVVMGATERMVPNGAIMSGFAALPPDTWAVVTMLRQKLPETEQSSKLWAAADNMRRMFFQEETAFAQDAVSYLRAFKQENITSSDTFKKQLQERYVESINPALRSAGLSEQDAVSVANQIAAKAAERFAAIPSKWADGRTKAHALLAATSESEPNIWEASKVFRLALVAVLTKDGDYASAKDRLQLLQKTTQKEVWAHVDRAMSGLASVFELDASDKQVFGKLVAGEDTPKNGYTLRQIISKNKQEKTKPGYLRDALQTVVDALQKASVDVFRQTFLLNNQLMEPKTKPTDYLREQLEGENKKYFAKATEMFARAVEYVTTEKYLSGTLQPDIVTLLRNHRNTLADPYAETGGKRPGAIPSKQNLYSATIGSSNTAGSDTSKRVAQAIIEMAPEGWAPNRFVQVHAQERVQQSVIALMGGVHSEDYTLRTIAHSTHQPKSTHADTNIAQHTQKRLETNAALCTQIDSVIDAIEDYRQKHADAPATPQERAQIGAALHELVSHLDDNHTPLPLPVNMVPHFTHSAHYPTVELAAQAKLEQCVTSAFESANSIGGEALAQMVTRAKENVQVESLQSDGQELSAGQHVRSARSSAALNEMPQSSPVENAKQAIHAAFSQQQLADDYALWLAHENRASNEAEHDEAEENTVDDYEPEPIDWSHAKQGTLDISFEF